MNIYLIRHGQTLNGPNFNLEKNCPDPELDETGLRQADLAGRRLQGRTIAAIYSSDLKRTLKTAELINRYTRTEILLRPQLREIDMGDVPRLGWAAFPEAYAQWKLHAADLAYPGGENGADVWARVRGALEEITQRETSDVALVTHGGVIMVALSAILGMSQEQRFRFAPIANCGISTLVYDGAWKVGGVNDAGHLEEMRS